VNGERAILVRKLEKGRREVVEAQLPVVITFLAEAAQPQYISERRLEKARAAEIAVFNVPPARAEDLHWPRDQRSDPPRARVKKRFAPDANLSAADRVKAIMSGGGQNTSSSSASVVEGDTAHIVEQLYRFLKHHELI
jgi:electron transfer flavoprotein alpha/beta subunit